MLTISQLFIYPIKSLGGIEVASALLTPRGLQHDRRWMLVDEHGIFLSQRDVAAMALFAVALTVNGIVVTWQPDGDTLLLPFEAAAGQTQMVEVWSDRCRAQVAPPEANEWFSAKLRIRCSLVYMPDTTQRRVDGRYAIQKEIVSFADGYPTLLIGQASLDDLNSRLPAPVAMQRFRPNIVFTGGTPYEEDTLERFTINGVSFFGVKLCARCGVTTIDPATAAKGKEPLRTLALYRTKNNKTYFGQNLLHAGEGTLHLGDVLEVTKRKKARIFTSTTA